MKKLSAQPAGFTLPVILLIGVGLMMIGLSLLQTSSSIRSSLDFLYQQRIANEAAEAGAVYTNYCLSVNGFVQTWGPANGNPNLSQNTDCNGATLATAPAYLMQNGTQATTFSVADLSVRSDGAIIFPSNGSYQQTRGSSATIANSLSSTRKQVVKWKQYQATISASGTGRVCSIISNELYCWGNNANGQLGNGTTNDSLVPVAVIKETGALASKILTDVTAGETHTCAVASGQVFCWGSSNNGQLGNGSTANAAVTTPVAVQGLTGKVITHVAASNGNTCALDTLGKVYCWGANELGQLGNGTSGSTSNPTPVQVINTGALAGKTLTEIDIDGYDLFSSGTTVTYRQTHACVVASARVYCWGYNGSGQIGNNAGASTTPVTTPTAVYTGGVLNGNVDDTAAGGQHVCALMSLRVYCWGTDANGELGDNGVAGTYSSAPVAVNTSIGGLLTQDVDTIAAGGGRGCARASLTATYYCWGNNSAGQIGDNTTIIRRVPTESYFLRPKAPTYIFLYSKDNAHLTLNMFTLHEKIKA